MATALDDLLQSWNKRLATIQAKAFCALVFDIDILLKAFGLDEFAQNCLLAFNCKGNALVRPFDALLQPTLLIGVGNMHELDAYGRTIGSLEDLQHFGNGCCFKSEHPIDENLALIICFSKSVGRGMQLIVRFFLSHDSKRIQVCVQVAPHAVGTDHHDCRNRVSSGTHDLFAIGCLAVGFSLGL